MICHLLVSKVDSELNFCFDKLREKNSFACESEYVLHCKHHCSRITGKDLAFWRQAFQIVAVPLAGPFFAASGGHRSMDHTGHRRLTAEQKNYSNAWTKAPSQACSQSEIIWLVRAAAARLAASARAAAGFIIVTSAFFKLQLQNCDSTFPNSKWLGSTCQ